VGHIDHYLWRILRAHGIALAFVGLLFLYDPYITNIINLGATQDVQYWLIATPVTIAFVAIMAIGAWIGYTMATTPPPKPIEEITSERDETHQTPSN
jgi:inner membrane protein involved in colicin E2 resistance